MLTSTQVWLARMCLVMSLLCLSSGLKVGSGEGLMRKVGIEADAHTANLAAAGQEVIEQGGQDSSHFDRLACRRRDCQRRRRRNRRRMASPPRRRASPPRRRTASPPRRRTPTPAPDMNFEYGGVKHGFTAKNAIDEYQRPEVVKSERCSQEVCHVCDHQTDDGCWHGYTDEPHLFSMIVDVKANSDFKSFAQEVFVGCYTSGGTWLVKVREIQNGKVAVFNNNNLVRTLTSADFRRRRNSVAINIPQGAKARIRTVLVPTNPNNPSSAMAWVEAVQADAAVDGCMTTNLCMAKLGTGSDAAFELRNNNGMQYKCLASGDLPSRLQETCSVWVGCMPQESADILKVLLEVSGALGSSSFTDKGNFTASVDPNECIDPAVEDPESWDCECFEEMKESCGMDGACIKGIMCKNDAVCASWKAEQCNGLIQKTKDVSTGAQGGDLNAALGQRSQAKASIGDALDGSLQGKCSQ